MSRSNCSWCLGPVQSGAHGQPNKMSSQARLNTRGCLISIGVEMFGANVYGARRRVWLSKPSEVHSLFPGVLFNMPVKSVRFPLRRGPMQGSLQRAGPCFNSFSQGNQRSRWSAVAGGSTFTATGQVGLRPAVWSYMWAIRLKNE